MVEIKRYKRILTFISLLFILKLQKQINLKMMKIIKEIGLMTIN